MLAGCLVLSLLLLTVLYLGITLPSRVIETGVQQFEGEERKMAKLAHMMGSEWVSDVPGPGLFVTAWKVTDVEVCPTTPALREEARLNPDAPPPSPPFDVPLFSAKFRTYTIFGIPAGKSSIPCEDS